VFVNTIALDATGKIFKTKLREQLAEDALRDLPQR
jgi:hypothetical protein